MTDASQNGEEQSFLQQALDTLSYTDLLGYLSDGINAVGGAEYTALDGLTGATDAMIGVLSETIATIEGMVNSGALTNANQLLGALNQLHAAKGVVESLQKYSERLETAQDAGDLAGGLGLLGSTAGDASDLIGAASGALAIAAVFLAPEAAALATLAATTLGGLSKTLSAIQSSVGEFNTLVQTIQNALDQAAQTGEPVILDLTPDNGAAGGAAPGTSPSSGPSLPGGSRLIEPIVITTDDNWQTINIDTTQQDGLLNLADDRGSPLIPPPKDPDQKDPTDPEEIDPDEEDPSGPGTPWDPGNNNGGGGGRPGGGNPGGGRGGGGGGNDAPIPFGPSIPGTGDKTKRDPLVLDLDGDGIELTAIGAPDVFFDADGDGVATLTAWVDPDDGLLARDIDGDGLIATQAELFGTSTLDAISDLALNDENQDGRIDADDTIWSDLRIWRDLNSDGQSSANELQTVEEFGLRYISLDAAASGLEVDDTLIHSRTEFEMMDGTRGQAASVYFGYEGTYSQSIAPGVIDSASNLLAIPNVKGFGNMPDLRVAAYLDPALKTMAEALVAEAGSLTGAEFQARFETLVLTWAGVEDVAPGDLPFEVNAQHEAFLDVFRGAERPAPSSSDQAVAAEDAYISAIGSLTLRFGIGLTEARLTGNDDAAEFWAEVNSPYLALTYLSVDPVTGAVSGGLERVLYEIARALPEDASEAFARLDQVMPFLNVLRDEYFLEEGARADGTSENEDFNAFVRGTLSDHIDNAMLVEFAMVAINSTAHATGTDAEAVLDPAGTAFARSLLIDAAPGDDAIKVTAQGPYPEDWSIAYVYRDGDGSDHFDLLHASGRHMIFLPDLSSDQVVLTAENDGKDAVLLLSNGDRVTFAHAFDEALARGTDNDLAVNIREFHVYTADGLLLDSVGAVIESGEADETLVGDSHGQDSFVYEIGDGADVIAERYGSGPTHTDSLILVGITRADVTLSRDGNDLLLTFANGAPGDSIRITGQLATNGFYSTSSAYRIERFVFGDGTVASAQDLADQLVAQQATTGDDIVTGLGFADRLLLSDGIDTIHGGKGADLYLRAPDVNGETVIEDNGSGAGDALRIQGFDLAEAVITRDGNDTLITLANGTVRLKNQFSTNASDVIEEIVFDDQALTAVELTALVTSSDLTELIGTEAGETLTGSSADELVDGLAGDDILNARGGSDTYLFRSDSGDDTIDESGHIGSSSVDTVRLSDVNPGDVYLIRRGADLVVEVIATGQTLTIDQQFGTEAQAIEFFEFADGTRWNWAEIAAHAFLRGTDGDDTLSGSNADENFLGLSGDDLLQGGRGRDLYVLRDGDGHDVVQDALYGNESGAVNTLRFEDSTLEDVRIDMVSDGGTTRDLRIRYGGDSSVLIEDGFADVSVASNRAIQQVIFADGTVLSDQDLVDRAVLYGTDEADVITGGARIDGLGGDDQITTQAVDATIYWRAGAGNDVITNRAFDGGDGRVALEGIALADVTLSRAGEDMKITLVATGEVITVLRQFEPVVSGRKYGVSALVFEDTELGRDAIANGAMAPGSDGVDEILGGWDNETLDGGLGADRLSGGEGSDLYVWRKGDGNDVISESDGATPGFDVLWLVDVADEREISFSRAGGSSYDLQITILETGEVITVPGQLAPFANGIDQIRFETGATLTLDHLPGVVPFADVTGADAVTGDYLDNVLQGLAGDDLLNGQEGADSYLWTRGDGNDTIYENSIEYDWGDEGLEEELFPGEGALDLGDGLNEEGFEESPQEIITPVNSLDDTLRLSGVMAEDVRITRPNGSEDLVITILDTGEQITVQGQFTGDLTGIEQIQFDDARFTRADILAQLDGLSFVGTGGAASFTGAGTRDHFTLSGGDETVITGGGRDRITIDANGGQDRVEGFERGLDGTVIEFLHAPFTDFAALMDAASQTSDGVRLDLGAGNSLLLVDVLLSDLEPENFAMARPPIVGTEGSDVLLGLLVDDTIQALGGDDEISGGHGDDVIGGGAGQDTVVFYGSSNEFEITRTNGNIIVTDLVTTNGNEGRNTLTDVELLSFLGDGATVSLVNRAPVPAAEGNGASMPEDSPFSGALPVAVDPEGDMALTYLLSGDAPEGLVLRADGSFDYTPPADLHGEIRFDYVVQDSDRAVGDPVTYTLTVTPVNDAPLIAGLGIVAIDENSAAVGVVGGSDTEGDALSFSIIGGADGDLFDIDASTGALSFKSAPDFENPGDAGVPDNTYEVQVSVSDGALSDDEFIFVSVTDVDETSVLNPVEGSKGNDRNLLGTEGADRIDSGGGRSDIMSGLGGSDVFDFSGIANNGIREVRRVKDFNAEEGDMLDLGEASVARVREVRDSTYLYLDGDRDLVVLEGVSNFVTDAIL